MRRSIYNIFSGRWRDFTRQKVLLVGGAHIDIYAQFRTEFAQFNDRIGNVTFGIGGRAFNAAALCVGRYSVDFATAVRAGSPFRGLLLRTLKRNGIFPKIISVVDLKSDGAYVAVSNGETTEVAVTESLVESSDISEQIIKKIRLSDYRALFLDCNLMPHHIGSLVEAANQASVPVCVALVSDMKAERAKKSLRHGKGIIDLVFGDSRSFDELFETKDKHAPRERGQLLCEILGADSVVEVLPDFSCLLYQAGQSEIVSQAPKNPMHRNGITSALSSAFFQTLAEETHVDRELASNLASQALGKTALIKTANQISDLGTFQKALISARIFDAYSGSFQLVGILGIGYGIIRIARDLINWVSS